MSEQKAIDATYAINLLLLLAGLAVLFGVWRFYTWGSETLHYADAARTICHKERINVDYLRFCNPKVDGPACTLESMSRVNKHLASIELECAPFQPDTVFVVDHWGEPVRDDLLASVD